MFPVGAVPRKRLGKFISMLLAAARSSALCQSLTLPLQQTVAYFRAFELALHSTERLPRGEDSFPILRFVSGCCRLRTGHLLQHLTS